MVPAVCGYSSLPKRIWQIGETPCQWAPGPGGGGAVQLYSEAVTKIRKRMMPPVQHVQIVPGMLKAYVRSLDPFSDYLSAAEFQQYKRLQAPQYAGVGMENRAGESRADCMLAIL